MNTQQRINFGKSTALELKVLRNIQEINDIQKDWETLWDQCGSDAAFLSPNWITAWLKANPKAEPRFICIYSGDQLMAISPMVSEYSSLKFCTILKIASSTISQYQSLVLSDPQDQDIYTQMVVNFATSQNLADLICIEKVTLSDTLLKNNFYQSQSSADYSSVLDIEKDKKDIGVKRTILSKANKDSRSKQRKLSEFGEVKFQSEPLSHEDFEKTVGLLFQWKKDFLRDKGIYGEFYEQKENYDFLCNLDFNTAGLRCETLLVDGKPVTMGLSLAKGNTYYAFTSAYDPEFYSYSTGNVLFTYVVEWMEQNGLDQYDFMGNPEAYKERFSNAQIQLYDYTLPLTTKGNIAFRLMDMPLKQWSKKAFYSLPENTRKTLIKFRT